MKCFHWRVSPVNLAEVQHLGNSLQIDPLICRLLLHRGIDCLDSARLFFRPSLDALHDPYLMCDMHIAIDRLDAALKSGERILLYGDYDVDGTTSVALLYSFLSEFYRNLDYYLPDRDKEGYGVSLQGVEYARETGCSLVIALDCGIKAHKAVDLARQYGIDFIICDHHMPDASGLPAAVACLDPKRPDCPYPYKDLSGCGLAFKVAQALATRNGIEVEALEPLLDLVAVSIACDIVPITGENRILTHFGLMRLNNAPRVGLWALAQKINRVFPLQVNDLVFAIGPLINAAGRIGDARDAVKLLLSADRNHALDYAGMLASRNDQRREFDFATTDAAKREFTQLHDWEERCSIVLYDPNWHKGIIGIAASRMVEAFHRPSVIITQSGEWAVGSARSVQGFDLYEALGACSDLFHSFGGHAYAAGMQLPVENIELFAKKFEAIVRDRLGSDPAQPVLECQAELPLEQITPQFWKLLKRFAPFGPVNPNPVFLAKNVVDTGSSRQLANDHVRLSLRQADGCQQFDGIGFGLGSIFENLRNQPFEIAYQLREEHWRGTSNLRLVVKSIRPMAEYAD